MFKHKIGSSFKADIYISGEMWKIRQACTEFVKRGACVSFTRMEFLHTDGYEDGAIVTIINYPRFPRTANEIEKLAVELTERLIEAVDQLSATVVCYPSGNTTYIYKPEKDQQGDSTNEHPIN